MQRGMSFHRCLLLLGWGLKRMLLVVDPKLRHLVWGFSSTVVSVRWEQRGSSAGMLMWKLTQGNLTGKPDWSVNPEIPCLGVFVMYAPNKACYWNPVQPHSDEANDNTAQGYRHFIHYCCFLFLVFSPCQTAALGNMSLSSNVVQAVQNQFFLA